MKIAASRLASLSLLLLSLLLLHGATGCAPPPEPFSGEVVPQGGEHATVVQVDNEIRQVLYDGDEGGVCLGIEAGRDPSQWRFEPEIEGRKVDREAIRRLGDAGRFRCFVWPFAGARASDRLQVCGTVVDDFDDSRWSVPCWLVAYRPDDTTLSELEDVWYDLLDGSIDISQEELLEELAAFRERARAAGLVGFAVRAELVAAHFLSLEGTAEATAEARRRLERLPAWLDEPAASVMGGLAAYQHARLELQEGRASEAWQLLETAVARFERSNGFEGLNAVTQQSRILAEMGSPREAARILRTALDLEVSETAEGLDRWQEISADEDSDLKFADAANQLAWVILLDPEAGMEELQQADALLSWSLQRETGELDRANLLINAAYLDVRLGRSPRTLEAARQILESAELGTEIAQRLERWVPLIQGFDQIRQGELAAALDSCSPLASQPDDQVRDPRLVGWALSCMARAQERLGNLATAESLYEQSILRQQFGQARGLGRGLELGPSQPAVDTARAARVSLARGDAEAAWARLVSLDQFSRQEGDRKACREAALPGSAEESRWQELEVESQRILAQLETNASRSAGQSQPVVGDLRLRERLQTLWREWPGCDRRPALEQDSDVDYRAFWVDDEIFLLASSAAAPRLVRRSSLSAEQLSRVEDFLERSLDPRQAVAEETWRERLAQVAAALAPEIASGQVGVPLARFALHGRLQQIPLAALPLPDGGFLGDRVEIALQPAGARAAKDRKRVAAPPLLVVDPERNLRGSVAQAELYSSLFPDATVLLGDAADQKSFAAAIGDARWFHADAHAQHDDVFPELSFLRLADGPVHWLELADAEIDLEFANLSSCESGRWPTTADSGSFGLGGLLARVGARWVVASRGKLDNEVALEFNRAFYREIAGGGSVPEAYLKGWQVVREAYPVARWSGLMLLRASGA